MARTEALSLLTEAGATGKLAELYRGVIDNVQASTISTILKNNSYSGTPEAGSVVVKRFVNSASQAYGTARTAGAGDAIKRQEITVNIDVDKEIVEEIAKKDLTLDGVADILNRRKANHVNSWKRELERAFFTAGYVSGTHYTPVATAIEDEVEETIAELESLTNDYVDGVDRDMIAVVVSIAKYSELRNAIDNKYNANINTAAGEVGSFHGVPTYKSHYLPTGVDYMVMAQEAIAQPVLSDTYEVEKIPLSNDFGIELFYSYGTEAVAPDMILYVGTEYSA
jgi:tetrahydromethanopterin S-methyltransferase subunit B